MIYNPDTIQELLGKLNIIKAGNKESSYKEIVYD